MPNWVYNYLKVTKGDPKTVWEAISGADTLFDFNRLLPQPENLFQGDVELDGTGPRPNWYIWNCQNWGTKWNACYIVKPKNLDNCLHFETAWSPAYPIMEQLFAMFPDHEFEWVYEEDMMEFGATCFATGGKIVRAEPLEFLDDGEPIITEEDEKFADQAFGVEEVND